MTIARLQAQLQVPSRITCTSLTCPGVHCQTAGHAAPPAGGSSQPWRLVLACSSAGNAMSLLASRRTSSTARAPHARTGAAQARDAKIRALEAASGGPASPKADVTKQGRRASGGLQSQPSSRQGAGAGTQAAGTPDDHGDSEVGPTPPCVQCACCHAAGVPAA